jgi:F-type H+-transporting ATPase subunit b
MNLNLTLFGQSLAFLIFVGFCWRFVWPPIIRALQERQAKIADGLTAAERGQQEHRRAEERATELLKQAKLEAGELLAQAQKRGNQLVEEAKNSARTEGERIKQAAQAEIQQELNRAKEALRARVAELAIAGAERILQQEVDAKAHKKALAELAGQL